MNTRILAVLLAVALPVAAQTSPAVSPADVSSTGSTASTPKANARAAKAQNTQSKCDTKRASRPKPSQSKKAPVT